MACGLLALTSWALLKKDHVIYAALEMDLVHEKNNQLFNVYMQRLRVYDERWDNIARRLLSWMDSDKAYYPEARPKILDLIGTAYMTVRARLGVTDHNTPLDLRPLSGKSEMVKAYFALVETLSRFRKHYTEPQLLGRVNFLIASIGGSYPTPQQTVMPSTTGLSVQENMQTQPSISTSSQSTVQPPKKKRKIQLDFGAIYQKDQKDIGLQAQGTRPSKTVGDIKAEVIDLTLDEPKHKYSQDREILENSHSQAAALEKQTPNIPVDVAVSLPSNDILDASSEALSIEQSKTQLDIITHQLPILPSADLKATVDESLHPAKIEDANRHHSPTLGTSLRSISDKLSPTFVPTDEVLMTDTIPVAKIEENEVQDIVMGSVEGVSSECVDIPASLNQSTETSQSVVRQQDDIPSSEQHDDSAVLSKSTDEDLYNVPNTKSSPPEPASSLQITSAGATPHNTRVSKQRRLDLLTEYNVFEEIQLPADGGFGKEMRIIAHGRGLSTSQSQADPLTFTINVNPQQFEALSRWNERAEGIRNSICISLACYLCDDLKRINFTGGTNINAEAFNTVHSSWPNDNDLVLDTSFCGKPASLPLSPPITTINGLLDLGPFLVCGFNKLSLRHQSDLTKYYFVLHSHHPTRAHLEPVALQRKQQLGWKEWSVEIIRPLELPASPFSNV